MELDVPLQSSTFMEYDTHVCGKIVVWLLAEVTDAFCSYHYNDRLTIDDQYMDGISLTHGHSPRKHTIYGLLQLLFMRSSLLFIRISVLAPMSITQCPSPPHPMWGKTTPVIQPVKVDSSSSSTLMISSGRTGLWSTYNTSTCCSFNNYP